MCALFSPDILQAVAVKGSISTTDSLPGDFQCLMGERRRNRSETERRKGGRGKRRRRRRKKRMMRRKRTENRYKQSNSVLHSCTHTLNGNSRNVNKPLLFYDEELEIKYIV